MNIFIMILLSLFMVGFYMMTAPSQRIIAHETEYAVARADMRAIAECALALHNARIQGYEFNDVCVEQYGIISDYVCMNASQKIISCDGKKPAASYIVTVTANIDPDNYNNMMEIMEEYYADAGSFGILANGQILAGGVSNHRVVPDAIIKGFEMTDGQLVYLTQYEIPDVVTEFSNPDIPQIECPTGTAAVYRFGRWQCANVNIKTNCAGDTIWDSNLEQCVADESRKPLCAGNQTAVMTDSVWECVNPMSEVTCPAKTIARYNYNTYGWECVPDPNFVTDNKKCSNTSGTLTYGMVGSTLRVTTTSCTDCEVMVTDPDTCASACVPNTAKLNDPKCYPGNVRECSGASRGFYFGFPSASYINNMGELPNGLKRSEIPIGGKYSQNRKFNCMDCGMGVIDTELSVSPYTAVCK